MKYVIAFEYDDDDDDEIDDEWNRICRRAL